MCYCVTHEDSCLLLWQRLCNCFLQLIKIFCQMRLRSRPAHQGLIIHFNVRFLFNFRNVTYRVRGVFIWINFCFAFRSFELKLLSQKANNQIVLPNIPSTLWVFCQNQPIMSGSWQSKCHQDRFRRKTNLEWDGSSDGISTHAQMITFPKFRVWRSGVGTAEEYSFYCSCFALLFLTF